MKRLLKAMATTAVTLLAIEANAIQVTYSFRVNSSGPSIYPCNAGLLTKNPYEGDKQVCYTEIDHKPCNGACVGLDCEGGENPTPRGFEIAGINLTGHPGNPPPSTPPKNNCVCTTHEGRKNGNYLHANYRSWGDVQDPHADVVSGGNYGFNKIFNEVDAYNKVLEKLAFNLGSELYTAKYFVDICYRGSQIDYSHFDTKWNILSEASVTDYGYGANSGHGYSKLAGLKHKAYVICTVQNKSCAGGNCNDQDTPISSTTVAQFNDDFLNGLKQGKFQYSNQSDWEDTAPGAFTKLIDEQGESLTYDKRATKFCKVRYVFEETNGLTAVGAKHRKWQKHGADVCTHTKIEMDYLDGACDGGHCQPH